MGRAKDVSAIPNIPCIISKEGFQNVKLLCLGGMWVLFKFDSFASKEKFLNHSGIGSWFTELIQAINSFKNDERIVWISIEGLPIKAWTPNTFRKIASLWGEYVDWEDADLKSLSCKDFCLKTNMKLIINERHKGIIQGKIYWIRVKELDAWFPNFQEDDQDDLSSDGESQEGDVSNKADNNKSDVDRVSESSFMHENETAHKDINSCKKGEKSKVGGSIFDLIDELVAVGQTIGYNMTGLGNKAKQRWIKELCQKHRINFASIQEAKAKSISLHTTKDLWENQMFDHIVGSSVGFSRGILCMWNPNMFVKEQVSTCDYFVALMGTWAPTSCKLRIISVYAPQELNERRDLWDYFRTFIDQWEELNERRDLWDYFRTFIDQWEDDTVIMGDFKKGFNSFVETTWKSLNIIEPNGLIRLKKNLQALKIAIKAWSKEANKRSNDRKINIQQNLSEVDKLIDQGKSNDEILIKRITLLNDLQELNNRNAMEIYQKAKIRWSIEGDENFKYFHGIMNKKRSQLTIRGTLANGEWILKTHRVKNEFFTHFNKQFSPIQAPSICFDFTFPTCLLMR
uniref:RNA-directed DNA polymerase, eukaryota n=1 Tax=Tanacetum cinerariifolium TaxID=118510 RepID=A0A6L2JDW0_TANCI|nr:RNA-directed DNA polymerase, eukaryota [Tanacetum cinerariifolium]